MATALCLRRELKGVMIPSGRGCGRRWARRVTGLGVVLREWPDEAKPPDPAPLTPRQVLGTQRKPEGRAMWWDNQIPPTDRIGGLVVGWMVRPGGDRGARPAGCGEHALDRP